MELLEETFELLELGGEGKLDLVFVFGIVVVVVVVRGREEEEESTTMRFRRGDETVVVVEDFVFVIVVVESEERGEWGWARVLHSRRGEEDMGEEGVVEIYIFIIIFVSIVLRNKRGMGEREKGN